MLVVLCALASVGVAHGAPPTLHDPPPSAILWLRYDPTVLPGSRAPAPDPLQRDLLLSAIRAGLSSGLFGNETGAHAIQALLAAAEIGNKPHLGAILDFAAHRRPDGTGMVIDHLKAVIAVEDTTRIPAYLRTLRALALATSGADPSTLRQSPLAIPGVPDGVQLTSSAWPSWMALSWTIHDGRFILAIGLGALEAWFAPDRAAGEEAPPPWAAHRRAVEDQRPPRTPFLEAYVDIAALRAAFPPAFASGRTPRMLAALGLQGASEAMIHVAALETPPVTSESPGDPAAPQAPLIALDVTTASAGGVAWRPLSESIWPGRETTGLACPPGTSVLVAKVGWASLLDWALNVYSATVQDADLPAFKAARARWRAVHAASLKALFGSLRPYLVLSDVPPPLLPIPGLATVFVAADHSGQATSALESLITDVLAPFSDRVLTAGPPGGRTWALKLDDRGVVRLPAWGFVNAPGGPLLVGGWGLPVVQENRSRLAPDEPGKTPK